MSQPEQFSLEFEGRVFTGDERLVRRAVADMKKQSARRAEMKRIFPGDGRRQMTALCQLFPSLREADGVEPWSSERFVLWALNAGGGSGLAHAVRFILNVWNSQADWRELLEKEAIRSRPEDPQDRVLWDGVQRLRMEASEHLRSEARWDAEFGRPAKAVTDAEVHCRLLEWFRMVGPFNIVDAFGTWDDAHRDAFRTWASHPFFP